jgi:predicted ribonuclease YlaK
MTTNHYFPDTSFFIKCPDFSQYLFDFRAYKLVVCKAVMDELDGMKRSDHSAGKEEREKSFNSREASRILELLQEGKLSLLNEGKLEFYKKVSHNSHLTSDEHILYTLRKYAAQHRGEGKIVFLSFDRNQRITAREPDSTYAVADPTEWENMQMGERQYLEVLGGVVNKDERVKQAYEEKIDLEFDLAEMELHGPLNEIEELAFRLDEARCKEKQEVERYLAEQRVIKEEEARQLRLKNLNKYQITLSSFFGKDEIKLPVEDKNFRKIGEVILGKGWRYLDYPGNFSTVQIQGKIRGATSPSVMISANRLPP